MDRELTEDDFVESYDADKYYLQISKSFDSEKQCKDFENQILQNQEDAEKWERLNSAFHESVDWTQIRFFAVTDKKDSIPKIAELDFDYQEYKKIVERLKKHEGCEGQDSSMCCLDRHKEEILEGRNEKF